MQNSSVRLWVQQRKVTGDADMTSELTDGEGSISTLFNDHFGVQVPAFWNKGIGVCVSGFTCNRRKQMIIS